MNSDCDYPTIYEDDLTIDNMFRCIFGNTYNLNNISDSSDYMDYLESALFETFHYWYAYKVRLEQRKVSRFFKLKKCEKCGKESKLELHHIIPVYRGGGNERDNILFLCRDCHKKARNEQHGGV